MAKTKSTKKSQNDEAVIYFEDEASANANICPSIKRLFDEIITGRPLCYTPIQVVQEFGLYIADIRANPVQVATKYDQVVTTKWLARAPKVSDFVNRWLGKDMSWWSKLSDPSNNKQAKEKLIEHNLRLVVYIAKKFENTGINIEDISIITRTATSAIPLRAFNIFIIYHPFADILCRLFPYLKLQVSIS